MATNINTRLLMAIAQQIDEHPDSYDQTQWLNHTHWSQRGGGWCGTVGCIAGHAAVIEGILTWDSELHDYKITSRGCELFPEFAQTPESTIIAQFTAGPLLELNEDESTVLFSPEWRPSLGTTPSQALRRLAFTGNIVAITDIEEMIDICTAGHEHKTVTAIYNLLYHNTIPQKVTQ